MELISSAPLDLLSDQMDETYRLPFTLVLVCERLGIGITSVLASPADIASDRPCFPSSGLLDLDVVTVGIVLGIVSDRFGLVPTDTLCFIAGRSGL